MGALVSVQVGFTGKRLVALLTAERFATVPSHVTLEDVAALELFAAHRTGVVRLGPQMTVFQVHFQLISGSVEFTALLTVDSTFRVERMRQSDVIGQSVLAAEVFAAHFAQEIVETRVSLRMAFHVLNTRE